MRFAFEHHSQRLWNAPRRTRSERDPREHEEEWDQDLFYFPSMEIAQLGFDFPCDAYKRHSHSYGLDRVMKIFESVSCNAATMAADAAETIRMFRVKNMSELSREAHGFDEDTGLLKAAEGSAAGNLERRKARLAESQ